MLALKTMFQGHDLRATYEVRLGEDRYAVRVDGDTLDVERGSADAPDATIATDPGTLATVLWHGGAESDLHVEGSRPHVTLFLHLFRARS
jgi:hypothetical protein